MWRTTEDLSDAGCGGLKDQAERQRAGAGHARAGLGGYRPPGDQALTRRPGREFGPVEGLSRIGAGQTVRLTAAQYSLNR